jgi:hypothetical protein
LRQADHRTAIKPRMRHTKHETPKRLIAAHAPKPSLPGRFFRRMHGNPAAGFEGPNKLTRHQMTTHDFRTPPSVLTWEHLKGLMLDRLGNGPSCECDDCQRTRRVMRAVELEQRQERAGWPALFAAAAIMG